MHILITGGTGFIGQQLIKQLSAHQLTIVTRSMVNAQKTLGHQHQYLNNLGALTDLDRFDAVINLAGEPIAQRWSFANKQKICASRWDLTARLSELFNQSSHPPKHFISASAIGIYGNGDEAVDEQTSLCSFAETGADEQFAHSVCARWEELALSAQDSTRVAIIRIGLVLGKNGGALAKMLPAFKLGLGGKIASGSQGMSWIHIDDLIALILYLLDNEQCQGIYNGTAPNPVDNATFTQQLGKTLSRPTLFPAPEKLLTIALGEMAELLTQGQFVKPTRTQAAGFEFQYPQLGPALKHILK
ncbi:TIGR01777 family oxidoreductase [Shewanella waksmanii]|uniref:TIGR01777 family oxidoreductase n=1 Tax=Shewanella waksmanii TaxID=213783 RepID=UPI00048BCDA5|nr:TIGR01777 family oxidoreductase [Shewanella waksmanii]